MENIGAIQVSARRWHGPGGALLMGNNGAALLLQCCNAHSCNACACSTRSCSAMCRVKEAANLAPNRVRGLLHLKLSGRDEALLG